MKKMLHKLLIILFLLEGLGIIFVSIYFSVSEGNRDIFLAVRLIVSLLMGLDALGYLLVAWGLAKNINWTYAFALVLLVVNILVFFFDDIGWVDISVVLFNSLLVLLLIIDKKHK